MTVLDFNPAGHQPLEPIENIKARADIVDIVGRYADLKRRGGYYWAKCPLHTDKTPSFRINAQLQAFICLRLWRQGRRVRLHHGGRERRAAGSDRARPGVGGRCYA